MGSCILPRPQCVRGPGDGCWPVLQARPDARCLVYPPPSPPPPPSWTPFSGDLRLHLRPICFRPRPVDYSPGSINFMVPADCSKCLLSGEITRSTNFRTFFLGPTSDAQARVHRRVNARLCGCEILMCRDGECDWLMSKDGQS
jgi:hypothetical protein